MTKNPLSFAIQMIALRFSLGPDRISLQPAFCSTISVMRNLSNEVFKCDIYSVLFPNEIC